MREGRAFERLGAGIARAGDGTLDFTVLSFGAWTVVYHLCLVAGIGTLGAGLAWLAAALPCAWLAFRTDVETRIRALAKLEPWPRRRLTVVVSAYAAVAAASAAVYAFTETRWTATWLILFVPAIAGALLAFLRTTGRVRLDLPAADSSEGRGALVALGWAGGLAAFSLFLVQPSADDTHYVHLSTWVAGRGEFPLRDTLFSDQVFPAIFYPPLSSFEALIGLVAGATGISAPGVTYLLATPVATALGVLALWRLLRMWMVPLVGLALSAALIFLLMAAQEHRTFGNLFIGRIWQGKIVFLVVLVPLLCVLLQRFALHPTPRQVVLLLAAGAAGVGLTSTATFLVPVLAFGCLAPLAMRSWKHALVGFVATSAYPLGSLAVALAVGNRTASGDYPADVVAGEIARLVLGSGFFAFIAVTAALVGPFLIASGRGASMIASTVLLAVVLYAPPVAPLALEPTGVGRVFWRLVWIIPVAALVGVAATSLSARTRSPALRAVPTALLGVALVVGGSAVWDSGTVEPAPSWKRPPDTLPTARRILAVVEPGDVVLAPRQVSQSVVIVSDDVTTVSPRVFYTRALKNVPAAHVAERLLLQSLIEPELVPGVDPELAKDDQAVARALRTVGVDVACVESRRGGSLMTLQAAGYTPSFRVAGFTCLEPGA